jgi:glutathione S-transferase
MITLYTFGPNFGLPDPSPFVTKALVLMKMSGLPFQTDTGGFRKAPKGKQPYINDDGAIVADSTFIRFHLEKKYGIDFDKGLTAAQRVTGWAVEKMCEDHLYWAVVEGRWMNKANFDKARATFSTRRPRCCGL